MKNLYVFKETGNLYEVLDDNAEMKNPETREWIKCVIYKSLDSGKTYVREETDFREKFKSCYD